MSRAEKPAVLGPVCPIRGEEVDMPRSESDQCHDFLEDSEQSAFEHTRPQDARHTNGSAPHVAADSIVGGSNELDCSNCNNKVHTPCGNTENSGPLQERTSCSQGQVDTSDKPVLTQRSCSLLQIRIFACSKRDWSSLNGHGRLPVTLRAVQRVPENEIHDVLQFTVELSNAQVLSWGTKMVKQKGVKVNIPAVTWKSREQFCGEASHFLKHRLATEDLESDGHLSTY